MVRHARRKRAYRQGDLDGLCGVYAAVNALRYVLGLRDDQCRKLFEKLIQALGQDSPRVHERLLWGMGIRQLRRLITVASGCRLKGQKLTFAARPLRLRREQRTLPHLWAALNEEIGPTCVAIIGLSGVDDHWCVIYRVTPKTLWLLDSSGQTRIYRSRCTVRSSRTRYFLEAGEILLLSDSLLFSRSSQLSNRHQWQHITLRWRDCPHEGSVVRCRTHLALLLPEER